MTATTTTSYAEGDVYLTVRKDPRWFRRLKPVKVGGKKPTSVPADAIVVKLHLLVPTAAFEPIEPEAVVTVPADLVQHVVEVEAQ